MQTEPIIADLSVWDGSLNIAIFKAKAHAAILRCQCGYYEDLKYKIFRAACESLHVPWTPYLFWYASLDAMQTINLFKSLTGHPSGAGWAFDGLFGAWIDIEEGSRPIWMTPSGFLGRLESFLKLFIQETGITPGIYCRASWWDENVPVTGLCIDLGIPLWVAHWDTDNPILPTAWRTTTWTLHQHSAETNNLGSMYGVEAKSIDLDNYRWGLNKFNELYGLDLQPFEDVEPSVPEKVCVNVSTLNLRSAPVVSNDNLIGTTTLGKIFYPDGVVEDSFRRPWYYIGSHKKLYLAAWLTTPA